MDKKIKWIHWLLLAVSHLLVAAIAVFGTVVYFLPRAGSSALSGGNGKLYELQQILVDEYIGETDAQYLEDSAAAAMVLATGDRWSYYVPAAEMQAFQETKDNSYVGIGVTIQVREDGDGFDVIKVEPGGSAREAGILPGDRLIEVEGQPIGPLGTAGARELIQGPVGTQVVVTVLRDGVRIDFTLTRRQILQQVASGHMLRGNVGYIRIYNFNSRSCEETITIIEKLRQQGATCLLFDVRFNPGGYKDELVRLLDYLLPEGDLFCSEYNNGATYTDRSDADYLDMPMAVLMNSESYSAAEFFAAALEEYGAAFTAGQPTTGKGYFQTTIELSDGSAVNLSVGKYYTPKGVSLAEVGGLVPNVLVEVDTDTANQIYSETLALEDDPQVQAAVDKLLGK